MSSLRSIIRIATCPLPDFCTLLARSESDMKKLDATLASQLLESVDTVLVDCDGVLWQGTDAVHRASNTIEHIKSLGKKVIYLTNNSTKTRTEYVEKCQGLGFPACEEEIMCTAYATAYYIKEVLKYDGVVYCIGSTGLQGEFDRLGVKYEGFGPDICPVGIQPRDLSKLTKNPEVGCVCVGFDLDFSFVKMTRAASYLADPACHFVATNTDSSLPLGVTTIPGTGAIVTAVETVAGRPPVVMGKPTSHMAELLMKKMHLDPERTLMIGDRLNTDIAFARHSSIRSLLVLTGVSTLEEAQADPAQAPDYYTDSIADLLPP